MTIWLALAGRRHDTYNNELKKCSEERTIIPVFQSRIVLICIQDVI